MVELLDNMIDKETRLSEARIFEKFPVGVFVIERNGLIDYINSEAARLIGFENSSEARNRSLQDIDSIINCGLGNAFNKILNGDIFRVLEHRCSNRLGHFAVLSIHAGPYRQSDGTIIGALVTVQDAASSYHKKAELEEAILELSIMTEVSEALSSTADPESVLRIILTAVTANQGLGFNRAFLFLVNEEGDKLIGKIAVGPANPEEAGLIWSRLSSQQRTLSDLLNEYLENENNAGFTLTSLINEWEIPLRVQSVFSRAIEENSWLNIKRDDEKNELTKEILARLNTDHLAVAPIISKDKKLGLIVADNQITGKEISPSVMNLLQAFANHTAVAVERSKLYDNLIAHADELEEKNKLLAQTEEQMIQIEKMSVIGELTSSIAHELRSPLAVIGGFANLMLSAAKNDANTEYLNIILSEARRTENVLHEVLDFSRASRTKSRKLDFNLLVQQTYELLRSRLHVSRKPPRLRLMTQNSFIWGNPDQLQHALFQFMNLALEETTHEGEISVITSATDSTVRLTVEFSGGEKSRKSVIRALNQIFNNPGGTYKLAIIAAGETIKYHGGEYGIEGTKNEIPKIFIELPINKGVAND